jgi:ADP-L-glycero-D-manno-heptose 6-epimerase
MDMKIVLTGSEGFIGGSLLKELKKDKNNNIYLLNQDKQQWDDEITLEQTISQCDIIFHVGAISDTTLHDCNRMLYWNYILSKRLFDLARKYDKKVVYSSSAATYGLGDGLPTNIYGWSKKLAEEYGLKSCEKFVALRYFNVYGPGEEHKGKMASVVYQAYKQGRFKLFPGNPKRDFIYVYDVITANLMAKHASKGIYEVGTGEMNMFETMLQKFDVPFSYHSKKMIPSWYQYNTKADKSKWIPGWKPNYDLQKGLNHYKEYLK